LKYFELIIERKSAVISPLENWGTSWSNFLP